MKISIITLFPEMFNGPLTHSILKRAIEKKLIIIDFINLRSFGIGKHKIVDDKPYGGGVGMILRADIVIQAIEKAKCNTSCKERIILLDAAGEKFTQKKVKELSKVEHLILVCGHYEGVDERVRKFTDEELSIGDYVLTGGEIPSMVVIDSVSRLIPNVLGKNESSLEESFEPYLEYPQYTRPEEFKGLKVPEILLSGNHQKIEEFRRKEGIKRTKEKRPDLLS